MEQEQKQTNRDSDTPTAISQEQHEGGQNQKLFTQEELNAIVSERVNSLNAKFEKKLREEIAKERAEAERLAKLSAEEKEKELLAKKMGEIESKERELKLRENRIKAVEELQRSGIPTKFVDFILSEDDEKMSESIETLKTVWHEEIAEGVRNKLRGQVPTSPESSDSSVNRQIPTVI